MKSSDFGRRQFLRQFVQYSGVATLGAIVLPHAHAAVALAGKDTRPLAPAAGVKIPGWRCSVCTYCNAPNTHFCEQCTNAIDGLATPCDYPECGCGAKAPTRAGDTQSRR